MMRPVLNREEYLALRDSALQKSNLKAVRNGNEGRKRWLVQMNYSCLPGDDGALKGATRMSTTVGMDIDHVAPEEMQQLRDRILAKKDELGLRMLEKSARGAGYHLVFKRRPELDQEGNLKWASELLNVAYDAGAKDITRVFYTTSADPEDLIYLDDAIFEIEEATVCSGAFVMHQQDNKGICNPLSITNADINSSRIANSTEQNAAEQLKFKGIPYAKIIDEWWKQNGGKPQEGERNVKLYQLAVNLRAICDNNKALMLQVMPRLGLNEQELQSIVDSACKEQPKGISKAMQSVLVSLGIANADISSSRISNSSEQVDSMLWDWGEQIEGMMEDFPVLKDICKGLKKNQYPAAMFVGGGLMMTLMTRCTYRFYHRPEELRRLNNSTLIIGDPASGKSFATRLFKLLAAPIVAADKVGKDAINAYREQMRTKGANKEKPKSSSVCTLPEPLTLSLYRTW